MPTAVHQGVRLHWEESGSGSPVLLVMGATYSSRMWYPVVDALAAEHRVISFDNRGTGQSQASRRGSIGDMAGDALAVLDAAGGEAAHVYGVSLGGVVTLELALQRPERVTSLVLGCTGILDDAKPRAPKALNALMHLPRPVLARLRGRSAYGPAVPPEAAEKDKAVLAADRVSVTGLKQQQDALRAYSTSTAAVAGLTVPALVLHGTADTTVPAVWGAELAATLPHAKHVTYEGAGHNYLVSHGQQANADVLAFLATV